MMKRDDKYYMSAPIRLGVVPFIEKWADAFQADLEHLSPYHHRIKMDGITLDIWSSKKNKWSFSYHNITTGVRGKEHTHLLARLLEYHFYNIKYNTK